jgi:hypothetical protein
MHCWTSNPWQLLQAMRKSSTISQVARTLEFFIVLRIKIEVEGNFGVGALDCD